MSSQPQFVFEAIGTHWQIDIYKEYSEDDRSALFESISQRIEEFDKNYSRFREDSLVTEISKASGEYQLPDDAEQMFDVYKKLYDATDGHVTPLIGNLISDLGYDSQYTLKPKQELHEVPEWDNVMKITSNKVIVKDPVLIDTGAIGKGYLIDIVSELLESEGITSYTVDAGGDIRTRKAEKKPLRIGLENPHNVKQVIGVIELFNQSICASSGNRRAWGEYHHIINPYTKKSQNGILAVWVIADTTIIADGIASALFFVNNEKVKHIAHYEYLILRDNFSIEKSDGFSAELFIQ